MNCNVFNSESRKVYVVSYANFAAFPATGLENTIYIDDSTNVIYRWDGSYQILGTNIIDGEVDVYANLPPAAAHNNEVWLVTTNSPGFPAGFYVSNGSTWTAINLIPTGVSGTAPINYDNGTGVISLSYNATNLKLTTGALNTIQDIASTSLPTFAGINLNNGGTPLAGTNVVLNFANTLSDGIYASLGGSGRNIGISSTGAVFYTSNLDYNATTDLFTYNSNGAASFIEMTPNGISFKYAVSGTAGGAPALLNSLVLSSASGAVAIPSLTASQFVFTDAGKNLTSQSTASVKTLLNLTGTNSGDVTLSGENYLSLASQVITANAINLANTNVTGILPNTKTTATNLNTISTIVARDGSGNFSAGTITASLAGNASTATALQTARTIGGVSFDGTANIVPQTIQSINEATDTTCFPLFISASGIQSLQPLNNAGFIYNSSANSLTATTFIGALIGNASTTTNIAGGAAGSLPYQTAPNTTAFLAAVATGQILVSNGVGIAPSWSSTPTLSRLVINNGGSALGASYGIGFDAALSDGNYINFGTGGRNIGVFGGGAFFSTFNLNYNSAGSNYLYNTGSLFSVVTELSSSGFVIKYSSGGGAGTAADLATGFTMNTAGTISASNLSGTNTGNVTIAGENYLAINSSTQVLTANSVDLSGTNATGILSAARFPAQIGDVTNSAGSLTNVISAGVVTLAKMANLAANSIIGNNTGSPATPIALTTAQVKTLLNLTGTNSGDVTLSGENYLSLASQVITANAINLANTNVTGILPNAKTTAASANTASAIVTRDSSGNFSAGLITAAMVSISSPTNSTGGSGDFTNAVNPVFKIAITASTSYLRIVHVSTDTTISAVHNYQTGKSVYWGESADTGTYYFRGRGVNIGQLGTTASLVAIDSSSNLTTSISGLSPTFSTLTTTNNITAGGQLIANTLGYGLQVKGGTNSRIGSTQLTAGTVTVSNSSVTANTEIFITRISNGGVGTIGFEQVVVGSGNFTISSSNVLDTSMFNWVMIEKL